MFHAMRYVYEVYREMSFSLAAKNLYISQPSLSAAVKKEEARIGFPIFDRSTNPIRLTEPGQEYIRSVERILDVEKGFRNYINDMAQLKSGSLTIGGTNFFISHVLPPILRRFTGLYPLIHIDLQERSTPELLEMLNRGALDLLLEYSDLEPESYGGRTLGEEHMLMAVPRAFPSTAAAAAYALTPAEVKQGRHLDPELPPVPLELFAQDPFLLLREGYDTRERAMRLFRGARLTPHIKLELEQQSTAYNLSASGIGISFVGDFLVRSVPEADGLLFYKLEGPDAVRQVRLYYRAGRYMTRATAAFLELVEGERLTS